VVVDYLDSYTKLTRVERDRRINNILAITDARVLDVPVDNEVNVFLKKEVLAAEYRTPRLISARLEVVRDLTQVINHVVQKMLYTLPTFVKGMDGNTISQKVAENTDSSIYQFDGDFSSFDSTQYKWCQKLEFDVVKALTDNQDIIKLWRSVIQQDIKVGHRNF